MCVKTSFRKTAEMCDKTTRIELKKNNNKKLENTLNTNSMFVFIIVHYSLNFLDYCICLK